MADLSQCQQIKCRMSSKIQAHLATKLGNKIEVTTLQGTIGDHVTVIFLNYYKAYKYGTLETMQALLAWHEVITST